ncbi:hypothetical protein SMICM304S_01531 [Streptomyces microflavus]
MFCDRITVMKAGRVVAGGTPAEVITEELIEDVYGVRAVVTPDGPDGRPSVRFLPRRSPRGQGRAADRRRPGPAPHSPPGRTRSTARPEAEDMGAAFRPPKGVRRQRRRPWPNSPPVSLPVSMSLPSP